MCPRRALIDGGASCNFIDQAFANNLNIEQWQLAHQLEVDTANGDTVTCSRMIAGARIALNGYEGAHDFVLMPNLDGFDVILGRTFLQESKAVVYHENATITWPQPTACSSSTGVHDVTPKPLKTFMNSNRFQSLECLEEIDNADGSADAQQAQPATSPSQMIEELSLAIISGQLLKRAPLNHLNHHQHLNLHQHLSVLVLAQLSIESVLVLRCMMIECDRKTVNCRSAVALSTTRWSCKTQTLHL